MYPKLLEVFGHIDGLVNDAGRSLHASIENIDIVSYLELNALALLNNAS
ncbi:hypothetical protein [Psychrobacter sp. 1Y4]|jgi:NADP-dependent 3-hydroxy acid dehydrogenase YdfG